MASVSSAASPHSCCRFTRPLASSMLLPAAPAGTTRHAAGVWLFLRLYSRRCTAVAEEAGVPYRHTTLPAPGGHKRAQWRPQDAHMLLLKSRLRPAPQPGCQWEASHWERGSPATNSAASSSAARPAGRCIAIVAPASGAVQLQGCTGLVMGAPKGLAPTTWALCCSKGFCYTSVAPASRRRTHTAGWEAVPACVSSLLQLSSCTACCATAAQYSMPALPPHVQAVSPPAQPAPLFACTTLAFWHS